MILTTTSSIEGYEILCYLGVATGCAIVGHPPAQTVGRSEIPQSQLAPANILKTLANTIHRMLVRFQQNVTYRLKYSFSNRMLDAQTIALDEIRDSAKAMGGEALIDLRLNYKTWNQVLVVYGTVVILKQINKE